MRGTCCSVTEMGGRADSWRILTGRRRSSRGRPWRGWLAFIARTSGPPDEVSLNAGRVHLERRLDLEEAAGPAGHIRKQNARGTGRRTIEEETMRLRRGMATHKNGKWLTVGVRTGPSAKRSPARRIRKQLSERIDDGRFDSS